jgi:ribosomal protein S18 acetylase RimI-like enzyme
MAYQGILPDAFLDSFTIDRREENWRRSLLARDSEVWIAENAGRALGWICVGTSRDGDADSNTAELWAMYVDPDSWRRGVGRALWALAEKHLRSERFTRVTLWVLRENVRAVYFYRSIGFVEDPGSAKTIARGGVQFVEVRLRREIGSQS